jgi:dihydrofolate reductase
MRVLMLHGYAQDGNTFYRKTSRLVHTIRAAYPDAYFSWPDGPVELHTTDIPGFETGFYGTQDRNGPGLRAWFHLRCVANPPTGLMKSLDVIAGVLEREGPFDGIIAFSQGTLLAGMVASLLDGHARRAAFLNASTSCTGVFQYPEAFRGLAHPPLKFGVLYATRVGREPHYHWLYEKPKISTSFCLINGRWDPMVEYEEQCAVLDKLSNNKSYATIEHEGGHFVPTDDVNTTLVVNFINDTMGSRLQGYNIATLRSPPHSRAVDPHELRRRLERLKSAVHHDVPLRSKDTCSVEAIDDDITRATPATCLRHGTGSTALGR